MTRQVVGGRNAVAQKNDNIGRVIAETNQLNKTRTFAYDAASNLKERIDRLGRKTTFEYDRLNRNTDEKWYDGSTLLRTMTFTYDAAGQLTQATDPSATYGYAYDALGRVTTESQSLTGLTPALQYARIFNAASSVSSLAASIGGTADFKNAYQYDLLQRQTQVIQQGAGGNAVAEKRADFSYDASGLMTKLSRYANATGTQHVASSHFQYDGMGRLAKLVHSTSTTAPPTGTSWGTGPLAGYQFTYDAASRIASIDSYLDGLTNYTHDNADQLTGADHTGQTDESYAYDANGNRTGGGYTRGTNNQLASDGTYNYTYDDEGSRLTKTKISTGEKEEYAWDHRNRLTKVTFKNSGGTVTKTVDQTYDVWNQWIRRQVDSDGPGAAAADNTFFSYADGQVMLQFGGTTAASLQHRYLWGVAVDQLLADETVTSLASAGTVLYPLGDHLGTLRDLTTYNSGTGATTIANHRRYDSFGNLISETNAAVDEIFGYTGRMLDDSTGQQNNLNRWYDSKTGLFTSQDPIGFEAGDPHLSQYVDNSPALSTDPTGLEPPISDSDSLIDEPFLINRHYKRLSELKDKSDPGDYVIWFLMQLRLWKTSCENTDDFVRSQNRGLLPGTQILTVPWWLPGGIKGAPPIGITDDVLTAAQRLGVLTAEVKEGVGIVRISLANNLQLDDIQAIKELLCKNGAKTIVVDSGSILNPKVASLLHRLASEGKPFKGGTIKHVRDVPDIATGKLVPVFEITY